jgi:hypothetical protein
MVRERKANRVIFGTAAALGAVALVFAYTRPESSGSAKAASTKSATATSSAGATGTTASSAATPGSASHSPTTAPRTIAPALVTPQKKYLGIAMDGLPASLDGLHAVASQIGKSPNLVEYYVPWGTPLNQTWLLQLLQAGALPLIQFEPRDPSMAQIAAGADDPYTTSLAETIKNLGAPLVLSFGHEMNGDWYPWGTVQTKPADFVAAWRHIHDIFTKVGARTVIWLWDANVIYPVPNIPLKPLYPGDAYVDWVGLTGYYNTTPGGRSTFNTLFLPTLQQVRKFSSRPVLLAETGASPSSQKPTEIENLFTSVEARSDVLGFVWFDYDKTGVNEADWRFDSDPASAAAFSRMADRPAWGFPITW